MGVFEFKRVNLSYWKMSASAAFTPEDMEAVLRLLQSEESNLVFLSLLERSNKMPPLPDRVVSHE
nr:MAG TPA: hypothetical protein [Caudoviricetes sp.]